MSTRSRRTVNTILPDFHNFLQGWLLRQERYLEELRSTLRTCNDQPNHDNLRDLIARVMAHYQQYYEEKSRIANFDVSLVFSPPWFSSFERTFFWIAGFKPGLTFWIANDSVEDMSREQVERMEMLKLETKAEERELENELARIQESVAAPAIFEVARSGDISAVDGKYDHQTTTEILEPVIETLLGELEVVLANADMLRTRTAERVMEILSPVQNVKFLAAVTELQLKIRRWGWQIDADRGR